MLKTQYSKLILRNQLRGKQNVLHPLLFTQSQFGQKQTLVLVQIYSRKTKYENSKKNLITRNPEEQAA